MNMAKRSSASSPRRKQKSLRSENIRRRRWTKSELEVVRRIAARQAGGDDSGINYEDIPRLRDEQLAKMVRLRDFKPKVPVSVRLDPRVLEWLKSKGEGHLTRINDSDQSHGNRTEGRIQAVSPLLRAWPKTGLHWARSRSCSETPPTASPL